MQLPEQSLPIFSFPGYSANSLRPDRGNAYKRCLEADCPEFSSGQSYTKHPFNPFMKNFRIPAVLMAITAISHTALAQDHDHTTLHVGPRWEECSFQLDPSLTQDAWREFTKEAGLVAYFRPLSDAKPLGAGHFEVSVLQWQTAFDDRKPAWNDTFIHPDSAHWLKEGSRLAFPGLAARVGITDKLDVGAYFTKNPGANYGFVAGQLQYNVLNRGRWSASARGTYSALFGPEDLKLNTYGADALVSREFRLYSTWASIAPYAGVSAYLTNSRETTEAVQLHNELVGGTQFTVGTVLKLSVVRIGVEYNFARLSTFSFKVGVSI
jgi:hypothetical protein